MAESHLLDVLCRRPDLTLASQILPRRKGILPLRRVQPTKIIDGSELSLMHGHTVSLFRVFGEYPFRYDVLAWPKSGYTVDRTDPPAVSRTSGNDIIVCPGVRNPVLFGMYASPGTRHPVDPAPAPAGRDGALG